ncbi:MAG: hypothetical protein ACE366_31510 [Bradymonadia bacterium]
MSPHSHHPNRRKSPTFKRIGAITLCLLALLAGCDDDGGSDPGVTGAADGGLPDAGAPVSTLIFTLGEADIPTTGPRGRLRLQADDITTGARSLVDLGQIPAELPARINAGELPNGRYTLTVFFDRDDDNVHDGCPWPPDPSHPAQADTFDNLYATAEIDLTEIDLEAVPDEALPQLIIERHICGPGDEATGLTGMLSPEEGVELQGPVAMYLTPLVDDGLPSGERPTGDDAPALESTPSFIPLFPNGLRAAQPFSVGQLLPGRYRVVFFEDADLDGQPTPCGQGIGGGDRQLAQIDELEIQAGDRTEIADLVTLTLAEGCPADLTGVTGTVTLSPMLKQALEEEQMRPDEGIDLNRELQSAAVRLALLSPAGELAIDVDLFERLSDQPLPRPFTVTGLPEGSWRMVVYLDADRDGLFNPCGGVNSGLDRIYAQVDRVDVLPSQIAEVEQVTLSMPELCATTEIGLTGRLAFDAEDGAVGSGRPIRLSLLPIDGAGEPRDLVIFENHQTVLENAAQADEPGGGYRFSLAGELPPGVYQARFYIDSNNDGVYTTCLNDNLFGDRASVQLPEPVEIVEGRLTELDRVQIVREADLDGNVCRAPRFDVGVQVEWGPVHFEPPQGMPLRLFMQEAGGWSADYRVAPELSRVEFPWRPEALYEPLQPELGLPPGDYTLTYYADVNGDGALGLCDGADPDGLLGSAAIKLDATSSNPLMISLTLEDQCYD